MIFILNSQFLMTNGLPEGLVVTLWVQYTNHGSLGFVLRVSSTYHIGVDHHPGFLLSLFHYLSELGIVLGIGVNAGLFSSWRLDMQGNIPSRKDDHKIKFSTWLNYPGPQDS